jgi:hypothetical protein
MLPCQEYSKWILGSQRGTAHRKRPQKPKNISKMGLCRGNNISTEKMFFKKIN